MGERQRFVFVLVVFFVQWKYMLKPECAIAEQHCDEQRDKAVQHLRLGSWFAKATGSPERHNPAPLPCGMMRALPCSQPASLGFVSSLYLVVTRAPLQKDWFIVWTVT